MEHGDTLHVSVASTVASTGVSGPVWGLSGAAGGVGVLLRLSAAPTFSVHQIPETWKPEAQLVPTES